MHKLFLDANILFAATYSQTGASYAIFELAKKNKVIIFSSMYAVKEAKLNITNKIGENFLPLFYQLISRFSAIDQKIPDKVTIQKYNKYIAEKDVPILLSALELKIDYLITLDKKDFRNNKIKNAKLPFVILQPGEYLKGLL